VSTRRATAVPVKPADSPSISAPTGPKSRARASRRCVPLVRCCCCCLSTVPSITLRCAVLCCAVLCCAVLCCAVLCCAVLCCAVLCCAVLCAVSSLQLATPARCATVSNAARTRFVEVAAARAPMAGATMTPSRSRAVSGSDALIIHPPCLLPPVPPCLRAPIVATLIVNSGCTTPGMVPTCGAGCYTKCGLNSLPCNASSPTAGLTDSPCICTNGFSGYDCTTFAGTDSTSRVYAPRCRTR
jgi:hypothetical protein